MDRIQVEIQGKEDQIKFASILISSGYTVRIATVVKNNRKVKVVEYWKEK